jgi:Zn-dependent protease with chaperone function
MKITGITLTVAARVSLASREMMLTAMLATIVAATMTGEAGQPKEQHVIVFVQNDANVPQDVKNRAEELAASMFAFVGVKIDWRSGEPSACSSPQALAIRLARNTPKTEKPGALAYAMPSEGVHIFVFWDRMEFGLTPTELLAHVMVHEITHILQRDSRHSKSGIMRARWTEEDHKIMKTHPLSFATEDVDLIHRGLATRSALATTTAAWNESHSILADVELATECR